MHHTLLKNKKKTTFVRIFLKQQQIITKKTTCNRSKGVHLPRGAEVVSVSVWAPTLQDTHTHTPPRAHTWPWPKRARVGWGRPGRLGAGRGWQKAKMKWHLLFSGIAILRRGPSFGQEYLNERAMTLEPSPSSPEMMLQVRTKCCLLQTHCATTGFFSLPAFGNIFSSDLPT